MRTIVKILLTIVAVVVIPEAFLVWAWRTRNPRALRLAKRFVKLSNPLYLRVEAIDEFAYLPKRSRAWKLRADIQSQAARFGVSYTLWQVPAHYDHIHVTVF